VTILARRKKWFDGLVLEYLANGGGDGIGCATSSEIHEMLSKTGKKSIPQIGTISQSLRGLKDSKGKMALVQVGTTKVARGGSRVRGYGVVVWSLANNPHLESAIQKYGHTNDNEN